MNPIIAVWLIGVAATLVWQICLHRRNIRGSAGVILSMAALWPATIPLGLWLTRTASGRRTTRQVDSMQIEGKRRE